MNTFSGVDFNAHAQAGGATFYFFQDTACKLRPDLLSLSSEMLRCFCAGGCSVSKFQCEKWSLKALSTNWTFGFLVKSWFSFSMYAHEKARLEAGWPHSVGNSPSFLPHARRLVSRYPFEKVEDNNPGKPRSAGGMSNHKTLYDMINHLCGKWVKECVSFPLVFGWCF